jgi:hypothetical protein
MKRFSKLKKQIESLFEPSLKMEFCCYAFPMRSERGSSSIPRFCVKLAGEIIWDYPKDFEIKDIPFGYWAGDNGISELVREYIDAPKDNILERVFKNETKEYNIGITETKTFSVTYGLTDLFKAIDCRLGKEYLIAWAVHHGNPVVCRILIERFNLMDKVKDKSKITFWENAVIGFYQISKQPPVTLEEAREQAQRVRDRTLSNNRK